MGLDLRRGAAKELVAAWLLRELPECIAVPAGEVVAPPAGGAAADDGAVTREARWMLPDGTHVDCVTAVPDEKERLYDGAVLVPGTYDGQVRSSSALP